jgi:predicted Ser/Thr protein kinase
MTSTEIAGFKVIEELGRGGMGVVYLAEETRLGRRVALKVISPALASDQDFRSRFEREARLAASLDHPNVVPVFAAGSSEGVLYLSMRYVPGVDLRALLAERGSLKPGTAAAICEQVGRALDAAHSRGLVHRDVKPGNILVTDPDGELHVYLSDFGLTKESSSEGASLTHTGAWVGTVDYVAPEQLEGRGVDARTDVYSLGCVLYQTLSGRAPYAGSDPQKMYKHMNADPPSLRDTHPGLAADFDPVIARGMAKDPDARYLSAGDLGLAASAAARGQAVVAPERTVAAGAAAATVAEADAPTAPVGADETARRRGAGDEATAVVRPQAQRSWGLIASGLVLVAAIVTAGVLALTGASDDEGGKTVDRQEEPRGGGGGGGDESGVELPPFTGYDAPSGYSAKLPAGPDWSDPSESEPTPGQLFRVQVAGPAGTTLIVDHTPAEVPEFRGAADSTRTVTHPLFGVATEYLFSGGDIPACTPGPCVDYLIDDGSGGGWGVLAGGEDFPLARSVAREVMLSIGA